MTFLQLLPLLFVLAGLILYTVLAGADLGTGGWQLTTRHHDLRARVYASIGPVWEANHVWLIFVLTVLWTAYPSVFAAVSGIVSATRTYRLVLPRSSATA